MLYRCKAGEVALRNLTKIYGNTDENVPLGRDEERKEHQIIKKRFCLCVHQLMRESGGCFLYYTY
jgi:hypothetical protein